MTNKNKHQTYQRIFSSQSHTAIEQLLPTSGIVLTDRRASGHHPARQTRITPLDVEIDTSRSSSRLTADPAGEWPIHPMRPDTRATGNFRTRPDSVPTHIRQSEPNEAGVTHQRQVVTLIQIDRARNNESRIDTARPNTGSKTYTSGRPTSGGGALPLDPDNSQSAFTPLERPLRGVRQDKAHLESVPPRAPAIAGNKSYPLTASEQRCCSLT
jgi:hypothetical protein